eukprot:2285879-Amphidinium_carterae.1
MQSSRSWSHQMSHQESVCQPSQQHLRQLPIWWLQSPKIKSLTNNSYVSLVPFLANTSRKGSTEVL